MVLHLLKEIRLTAIALILLLLIGWVAFGPWSDNRRTDKAVTALADRLDAAVESGRYVRADPATITEKDAWGRTLTALYREEGIGERVSVRSAGKDGEFNTEDDVVAERLLLSTRTVAANATSGVIDGVKDAVKESVKKRFSKEKAPE